MVPTSHDTSDDSSHVKQSGEESTLLGGVICGVLDVDWKPVEEGVAD